MDSLNPEAAIDRSLIIEEWPEDSSQRIYLNSGSCGIKPKSVLHAVELGYRRMNSNPTLMTFIDEAPWHEARSTAAQLFNVNSSDLILTPNSTFGIQLVMQSMLLEAGDEFVTTNQEHGSVNTLCRYLAESREIVIKRYAANALAGSETFCKGMLELVSKKTKLVLASQINCLTGWRPQLNLLQAQLKQAQIPLLLDGAHAPGQGEIEISQHPFWVASGHKWMGAPNGCGFLYVHDDYKERLRPVTVGDRFYDDAFESTHRLEWPGTCDPIRLLGLKAAIELQMQMGPAKVAMRQKQVRQYLENSLRNAFANAQIWTPSTTGETSALLTVSWDEKYVKVKDLRDALWQKHKIWTQPIYASSTPQFGMRISCNVFNTEEEIDSLLRALHTLIDA